MKCAVYDTGALIAVERDSDSMRRLHRSLVESGAPAFVPAPVLAQAWRGGSRQARLAQFLKGCELVDMDVLTARQAGILCGQAKTSDVVDATVVVLADRWDALIVTSDPGDLKRLMDAARAELDVHVV